MHGNLQIPLTDVRSFYERIANTGLPDDASFLLTIERHDIVSRNVGITVDRLMILSDGHGIARRSRDRLVIEIAGYEFDPRPHHEIPEIVRYLQSVARHWNYWLAFVDPASELFPALIRILSVPHRIRGPGDVVEIVTTDAFRLAHIWRLVAHLQKGLKTMDTLLSIPVGEAAERAASVARAIEQLIAD